MTTKAHMLTRIILCVSIVFMSLFLVIGYAALSDTLEITGEAHWREPVAIYITSVRVVESDKTNNITPTADKEGYHVVRYGDFSLQGQTGWGSSKSGGYVTVEITVRNNSGKDQYFQKYIWEYGGNVTVGEGIKIGEKIVHDDSQVITIRIQNASSTALSMTSKDLMLVFSPQFDVNDTVEATKNVADIFQNVLDGKGPDGEGGSIVVGNKTYTADQIINELMNRMTDNPSTGDYMGNVAGAPENQQQIIDAIFEDAFLQVGDQTYSVHLLIKEQEINGDNRPDMVLYVTADQLNVGGGNWQNGSWGQAGSWQNLNYVPVYGLVFINTGTANNRTVYEQCEHMFMGEAPVCNFGGDFGANNVGNFNTNQWRSTEFDVTDGSADNFNQDNNTSDGELNEAYYYYVVNKT